MNNDPNNTINSGVTPQVDNTGVAPAVQPAVAPTPATQPVVAPAPATQSVVAPTPATQPVVAPTPDPSISGLDPQASIGDSQVLPTGEIKGKPDNKRLIIFGVIIVILAAVFIYLLKNKPSSDGSSNSSVTGNETPIPSAPTDSTTLEDVIISGYQCTGSTCSVTIENAGNSAEYGLDIAESEFFTSLGDYEDYVKVNINYVQKEQKNSIVSYTMYLKSTNEDISSIKTEAELRAKIGLFAVGNHIESLKLSKVGSTGSGFENDTAYTYKSLNFIDSNNNSYEMKYKNPDNSLTLTEGNTYTVTFDVVKDDLGYNYIITNIK